MSLSKPENYGITASFIGTMRNVGQNLSMCVITIIMNIFIGRTPLVEASKAQITTSMKTAFILFSAVCAIGVFISLNRKSTKNRV
jgi:Na+/melibiose symporter-like transporter